MFDKIKKWYQMGLWTTSMISDALSKGAINEIQYMEILGKGAEG